MSLTAADILDKLSPVQRELLMEALCNDLGIEVDEESMPDWRIAELQDRRSSVQEGPAQLCDFEELRRHLPGVSPKVAAAAREIEEIRARLAEPEKVELLEALCDDLKGDLE